MKFEMPKFNRRLVLFAPGVLGVANLLLAQGNIWMMITGVCLLIIQAMDLYEQVHKNAKNFKKSEKKCLQLEKSVL